MMRLVEGVDWTRYSRRIYIVSSGDTLSESKALALEQRISSGSVRSPLPSQHLTDPSPVLLPPNPSRSPRPPILPHLPLHDPLFPLLLFLLHLSPTPLPPRTGLCRPHPPQRTRKLRPHRPLLLPPTRTLLLLPHLAILIFFSEQILGLPSPSLIYIESLARTRKLSLSAILVRPLVDRFFVQWETLRDSLEKGGGGRWRMKARVEFEGWLV